MLLFQQCSPDSLFDSDDCVLTDVNLSEASEAGLLLSDYKNKFSYSSLNSVGDSYPNSPINGKLNLYCRMSFKMSSHVPWKVNYNPRSIHIAKSKIAAFIMNTVPSRAADFGVTFADPSPKTSVKHIIFSKCLHANPLCVDTIQIEQCRIKTFRSEHSLSFNCHINNVIIFRIASLS